VNNGLNPWTHGKRIQIYVTEWGWDMREVSWKGKTITVEYELFIILSIGTCINKFLISSLKV